MAHGQGYVFGRFDIGVIGLEMFAPASAVEDVATVDNDAQFEDDYEAGL